MSIRKAIPTVALAAVLGAAAGGAAVFGLHETHGGDAKNASATTQPAPAAAAAKAPSGNSASTTKQNPATTTAASGSASSAPVQDVSDLYDRVRPSVVKITGASSTSGGVGSGVILDTKGDILTNYHVINGFNKLDAKLADGTDATATVVGTDPGDDLAVIKISVPASQLKPVTLGDSAKVRIGQQVIAIGNPLELEGTLTEGVISGEGRVLSGDDGARPQRQLFQIDAAINPGNSGGGLFDMSGNLIGITNAIENPSGQDVFAGIGYAIPSGTASTYLSDMLAGKSIEHAKLGLGLQDITPAIAQSMGLSVEQGVLVGSVDPASGAAKAGIQGSSVANTSMGSPGSAGGSARNRGGGSNGSGNGNNNAVGQGSHGDVIVGIDSQDVKTYNDLANYIDTKAPGDTVTLKVVRSGSTISVPVTLDEWTS